MKRTLFQTIIKESIQEGGNAVPSAEPIRGDLAGEIAQDVIHSVSQAFGCNAEPAGSTGKKGRDMTSGDVDILLDLPWEKSEEVAQWVKESFPNCEMAVQPGFKQISFGYQYNEDGTPKVAQVDLMFTSNMNWRRWSAYSPSPYESKFKGLVQTVLLKLVARSKPIDKEKFPDEFYTAQDYNGAYDGELKSHWRYMWDAEIGYVIVHRSNEGKTRPVKTYTIKEDTILVTKDIDEALKLIFGPEATTEDMKSPETMVRFLFSGKYEYGTPETLQRIHDGVVSNKEMEKVPGAIENFEALWNEYASKEQGEPAYRTSISERMETLKINLDDVKNIARSFINEYRERKSYIKPEDAEFVERMNEFCKKYGYEPFTYSRKQGIDPEAYAKQILKRHNTFLRGVDTAQADDDGIKFAKDILAKRGITNPSMEQIAQIAATVPYGERKAHYVSTKGNADIYSGGDNSGENFSGTAKIIRPYTLGPDRMKWFDEADFEVTDSSTHHNDGSYGNQQTANIMQAKPGEVIDTWDNWHQGNTELLLGGETDFGGWVTDKERDLATFGSEKRKQSNDKYWEEYRRIMDKKESGQKLSKKEEKFLESKPLYNKADYDKFLTSRNNYHRKQNKTED